MLFELLVGIPTARLFNNLLFLLFGNLIGIIGCYLLEYKSREHFLVSRLMRVLADRVEPAMALLTQVWASWRRVAWALEPCAPRVWRT